MPENRSKESASVQREFVCAYNYLSPEGDLLFRKIRYRLIGGKRDKDFGYRHPVMSGCVRRGCRDGVWSCGRLSHSRPRWTGGKPADADRYLYRLPSVLRGIERGREVWWTEGEKDADRLRAELDRGAGDAVGTEEPVTSHHGGAGKVFSAQARWLAGARRVWIVVDDDAAGAYDALARFRGLVDFAGVSERDVGFLLPSEKAGFEADLSDHLDAGLSLGELEEVGMDFISRRAATFEFGLNSTGKGYPRD